ncbi:unnamed protein product [Peronospora belbahrii]|uniref:Helicase-associated domain-containing protein n=1 Tax=Peronospora belbahrii TaxID=622444 RepID=A0ABN8D7C9_9STRA|nr:unnamed protein product [Peronospora belbahrii]
METAYLPGTLYGYVLNGMKVDVVNCRQDKWLRVFMPALRTFHSLYGQMIGRSNETKQLYHTQVADSYQELQNLGFTWTVTNAADRSWKHQILPAFQVFHQNYGHCNITSNFVVPKWEPWPQNASGLNLGEKIVKQIQARCSYVHQVTKDMDALKIVGISLKPEGY